MTIDAHAAGEPCRVVYDDFTALPGRSMADRRRAFQAEWDWIRTGLTREPRGHSGMFGAVLTAPVHAGSAYGLIFFDPIGYMDACGHGTLCSVAVWRRIHGHVPVPFTIDNPDGTCTRVVRLDGDEDSSRIELDMPPARVVSDPDGTPGSSAIAHCGNTFVIVEAGQAGIRDLRSAHVQELRDMAIRIRDRVAVGADARLEVLLYGELEGALRTFATFVVFNGSQIDRSPCGTGSAALTALLLSRGALAPGEPVRMVGPAGEPFELEGAAAESGGRGCRIRLRGTAHITGVHEWIFAEADALARGYLLE